MGINQRGNNEFFGVQTLIMNFQINNIIILGKNKKSPTVLAEDYKNFTWCGAGSNRRHMDFQSIALPSELPHRNFECAKIDFFSKPIIFISQVLIFEFL